MRHQQITCIVEHQVEFVDHDVDSAKGTKLGWKRKEETLVGSRHRHCFARASTEP
jgi:hypothetical protein